MWEPQLVDFGEIKFGKKEKISVELTNLDSTKTKIILVDEPSSEYIKKTKIKKKKLKPGKSTKIEFQLTNDAPYGKFNASITLEAEDKPNSRITIPILGQIVADKLQSKQTSSDNSKKNKKTKN